MYVASRAHAMRARVRTGGGGRAEAASSRTRKTFFCKKSCWADAPTPYFKEGGGLGVYTFLRAAHNTEV